MTTRDEEQNIERKMMDMVTELVAGTHWAPPEGGIVVDAVCIILCVDPSGRHGLSWMSGGSVYQAEGMIAEVHRRVAVPGTSMWAGEEQ